MADEKSSLGNWYDIGFAEGFEAAAKEAKHQEKNFEAAEDALALAHGLLNGKYNTIRRRQIDFGSFSDLHSWMEGAHLGISSAGGRLGFQCTVDYPQARRDGGTVIYLLVVRDIGPVRH